MLNLFDRAAVVTSVGALGLVVLTACGGGGNDDADKSGKGEVASLTSPAAEGGSASASAEPDAGRPQIRLDSTNEEVNRMYDAWLACLKDHGAAEKYKRKPNDPAVLACKNKEPLDPPELDPAKNPDYSDDVRAMVKCMKGHGIKALVSDGNWALETGDELNRPHYDEYVLDCQVKAFGEHK
ncbi:hypothetical protein ABZ848_41465 [Streptomyces sp. NPDC047081]|uniref:hypothetical protein n=1 Tax=Streptomyces sp. NPDC047081 TaxID=3154706 RepID=UPI00340014C7